MSTHQQLLYHLVFSTKNRRRWLTAGFRENVFAYMAGTARQLDGFAIRIGGYLDHVHLLVRLPATVAVSEFIGPLKSSTSKHINETYSTIRKFGWQKGYGAFTVSVSQKPRLIDYIDRQVEHHSRQAFEDEYLTLLRKNEVEFDPKYVWD